MQREINELRYTIETIRKQNIELLSSASFANLKNIDSQTSDKIRKKPEYQPNEDIP